MKRGFWTAGPVAAAFVVFALTAFLAGQGWTAESPKRVFFVPGEDPEVFLYGKPYGEGGIVKTLYRWGVFVDDEGRRDRLYLLEEAAPSAERTGWSKVRHEFAFTLNGEPMTLVGVGWVKSSEIESGEDHRLRRERSKHPPRVVQKKKGNHARKKGFQELKRAYPEWGEETVRAIAKGKISLGMTGDQVKLSWGEPAHRSQDVTESGERDLWRYGTGEHLYFQKGVLTVIRLSFH